MIKNLNIFQHLNRKIPIVECENNKNKAQTF